MSDREHRKALRQAYKLAMPPMGIYRVRHEASGRSLIGKSRNATGALNRHRMELRLGSHRNAALMADFRSSGEASFSFEVIDWVKERPEPDFDYNAELERLLQPWLSQHPTGSPTSYA